MSAVNIIWKCSRPKSKIMAQLCESLMTKSAQAYGMDTAIIRKEPHSTTRVGGSYIQSVPHITGDIVNMKDNKGYALHWNTNAARDEALPDLPPNAPNPVMWELVYKSGKGFVLVGDETETVREV